MAKIKVVTPENLGDNFKHEQGKIKINIDNDSIVEDENGILKVNPYANSRVFSFAAPTLQWHITHDLGKSPTSIMLFDNDNKKFTSEIIIPNETTIIINFGLQSPMSGYCIISL